MTLKVSYAPTRFEAYGDEEIAAVVDALRSGWLGCGPLVERFEHEVARRFGRPFGVMVNSGSSANMLASEYLIEHGVMSDPVATPALTFPTTIAYLVKRGVPLELVDVEEGTYQIDLSLLPDRVGALLVPDLVGNVPDWAKLHARGEAVPFVVEDSCDTITDAGRGTSRIVTASFYASHILTAAGGGGMVMADDPAMREEWLSKRAWGRRPVHEADFDARFGDIDGLTYDQKYAYHFLGHNLQPIEIQAAFGLVQLTKLDHFLESRRKNFERLLTFFRDYEDRFILPTTREGANWLAFPLTIRERVERTDFAKHLEIRGIQTRPIFAGNITRQPAFSDLLGKRSFPVADRVMSGGILLGIHQGLTETHISYVEDTCKQYLDR